MAAIWTTHRERGSPALLRLFTWIALRLGRPVARLILYPITVYFVIAGGAARAASRDYLKRVLGREPRMRDGFRHVHCFASVVLDRLYLLNDRHDLFEIEVVGSDVIRRALNGEGRDGPRPTRGAFVIGAHVGSFEAVRVAGRHEKDLSVSMVMYEDNAQYLNQVFAAINPRLSESIIPLGRVDSMLRVKRALDDGGLVGMLADRSLAEEIGTSAVRRVPLLGATVTIPTGPFRMAAMLKRPVVFIVGLYRGGNRYEVHYEDLFDFSTTTDPSDPPLDRATAVNRSIDAAIASYVARLEHYCRVAPFNWFNFFDYWNDEARPGSHLAQRDDAAAGTRVIGVIARWPMLVMLAASLGSTTAASAADAFSAKTLMQALAQTRSSRADFTDRKYLASLDRPLESSGELVYVAPSRLERRTLRPKPETLIVDGDTLTIERNGTKRSLSLSSYPEVAAFTDSIRATLAGDLDALSRDYRVVVDGQPKHWRLTLLPSNPTLATLVSRVTIDGHDGLVDGIEVLQADGSRSVTTIVPHAAVAR